MFNSRNPSNPQPEQRYRQ